MKSLIVSLVGLLGWIVGYNNSAPRKEAAPSRPGAYVPNDLPFVLDPRTHVPDDPHRYCAGTKTPHQFGESVAFGQSVTGPAYFHKKCRHCGETVQA